jgi:hypothetical protein
MAAMKPQTRSRRVGGKRALTLEKQAMVRRTICDKHPAQLKMEFAFWSCAAVMELIEREWAIVEKNLRESR